MIDYLHRLAFKQTLDTETFLFVWLVLGFMMVAVGFGASPHSRFGSIVSVIKGKRGNVMKLNKPRLALWVIALSTHLYISTSLFIVFLFEAGARKPQDVWGLSLVLCAVNTMFVFVFYNKLRYGTFFPYEPDSSGGVIE